MTEKFYCAQSREPDHKECLEILKGKRRAKRIPMMELMIDNTIMKAVTENFLDRKWVEPPEKKEYMGSKLSFDKNNREQFNAWLDNIIAVWYYLGYDFVRIGYSLNLPTVSYEGHDRNGMKRTWQALDKGTISSMDDFKRYPWPKIAEEDYYMFDYISKRLPDGMGLMGSHAGGVYEHTSRLMGYESLCYALYDNPELVQAVAEKLTELLVSYNQGLLEIDRFEVIFQGDDFGFNTQTLLPPASIREYFFDFHRKTAKAAHGKGKAYYLHSCGKVDCLMPDLIEDIGIDGKHGYQDNVLPITEYKKIWGEKIALLGGIDMDKLCMMEESDLRLYVRSVIEACTENGRYACGSGNSISSYVPLKSYLTMVEETIRFGK